jgi:hypothetical protein
MRVFGQVKSSVAIEAISGLFKQLGDFAQNGSVCMTQKQPLVRVSRLVGGGQLRPATKSRR